MENDTSDQAPATVGTSGQAQETGQVVPFQNRAQRRAAAKSKAPQPMTSLNQDQAMADLIQVIVQNRINAVETVLDALFESAVLGEDVQNATNLRLKGLGGAVGIITMEALRGIAAASIEAGILLPSPDGAAVIESVEEDTELVD